MNIFTDADRKVKPLDERMFAEYEALMQVLGHWQQRVYRYNDDYKRFGMSQLTEMNLFRIIAAMRSHAIITLPAAEYWRALRPCCVSYKADAQKVDLYHHGSPDQEEWPYALAGNMIGKTLYFSHVWTKILTERALDQYETPPHIVSEILHTLSLIHISEPTRPY